MERSQQTMQLLEKSLREQGVDTVFDNQDPAHPAISAILSLEQDGFDVRTELRYVPCGELFDALQLYTAVASSLEEHDIRELSKAVHVWNRSIFLGALDVWKEKQTLYHRYSLILSAGLSAEQCAALAESVLVSILQYLKPLQQHIVALLSGMTFEQQQDKFGDPQ